MVERDVKIITGEQNTEKEVREIMDSAELKNLNANSPEYVDLLKQRLVDNKINFVHEYNRPSIMLDEDKDEFKRYKKGDTRSVAAAFSNTGAGDEGRIFKFLDGEEQPADLVYFIEFSKEDHLIIRKVTERCENQHLSSDLSRYETNNYVLISEVVLM